MISRLFAVIPAAGHSRRMGRPKLLLPCHGTTILGRLLTTLSIPAISTTCVVTRSNDVPLQAEAAQHGAWVISPTTDPPDMRHSVEYALQQIAARYQPQPDDGWLLIPADHPLLSTDVLTELLQRWHGGQPAILVPTYNGRRGHPTLFRWSTVELLKELPAGRGLNWLMERLSGAVREWPCSSAEVIQDLDTPEDYERLLAAE